MPRPECTGAQSIAEQSQSGYSLQSVRTSPFVILAGRHREHPEHVSEIEQPRTLGSRPCLALDSGLLRGVASISTARMLSSLLLVGPAQTEEPTRNYCLPPDVCSPLHMASWSWQFRTWRRIEDLNKHRQNIKLRYIETLSSHDRERLHVRPGQDISRPSDS